MTSAADFTQSVDGDSTLVRFTGELTLPRLGTLPDRIGSIAGDRVVLDVSSVERMDTVGAWLLYRAARGRDAEIVGANEHFQTLLQQVEQSDQPVKIRPDRTPPLYRVLNQIGGATAIAGRTL